MHANAFSEPRWGNVQRSPRLPSWLREGEGEGTGGERGRGKGGERRDRIGEGMGRE